MQLRISTWNGHDIQDATYETSVPPGQLSNLKSNGVAVPRTSDWPALSTSIIDGEQLFTINIKVKTSTFSEQREELKGWFAITDSQRHNLVAEDTANGNTEYYLTGIPVQFVELRVGWYAVTLHVEMKAWRLVNIIDETTWSVTASGQTTSFDNTGNIPCKPIIKITPVAGRTGGYRFSLWVPAYNVLTTNIALPFDITDGGFDTATAVTAGDMLSSGDDVQILVDGVQVERWLGNMNTATTKIWINLVLSGNAGRSAILSTSIAGSGAVTQIVLEPTAQSTLFLQTLAAAGNKVLLIGSEAFVFDGVDLANFKITNSAGDMRAKKDTSMAAHASGATVRHIEHDIWFNYGNSSATAPTLNTNNQPIFDLDASENDSWVYSDVWSYPRRPAGFSLSSVGTAKPDQSYSSFQNLTTGGGYVSPGQFLGTVIQLKYWATVLVMNKQINWTLYHPAGITDVLFSGDKYIGTYPGLAAWPSGVGLFSSLDGTSWVQEQTETAPATVATWDDFGPTTVTLASTMPFVKFSILAQLTTSPTNNAVIEIQWDTITVGIEPSTLPVCSVYGVGGNNPINAIIYNNTTGEYITINTICKTDEFVVIDCENRRVYYSDGTNRFFALGWSPGRSDDNWLDCPPGTNDLEYIDAGITGVDVVISHRDRVI